MDALYRGLIVAAAIAWSPFYPSRLTTWSVDEYNVIAGIRVARRSGAHGALVWVTE